VSPPTYTITKRELTSFVGDSCVSDLNESSPLDPLAIACSALHAAAQELHVLCHVPEFEAVDADDFAMVLIRLARRLQTTADVVWERGRADTAGGAGGDAAERGSDEP